jgi:transposase
MAMTTMTEPARRVTGGVDTHKHTHTAAALDQLGRELGVAEFEADGAGYRALVRWFRAFGEIDAVGVEGTGAWGAGLARHLRDEGVRVVEVQRPNRQDRRRYGKSDPTDATSAARAVLAGRETREPKTADGPIEAIRLLRVARRSARKARSQAMNQLHAITDTAPEQLRSQLRGFDTKALIARAARFRVTTIDSATAAAKATLRSLARRCAHLSDELADLDATLAALIEQAAPSLLDLNGVGTDCAGALLVAAGDNPDRFTNERSYAAVCGTSPTDASTGLQERHRLNRGGDRQANCALYIIVLSRLRWDQRTQAYMARRLSEGKTRKEVIRCLKRYVTREIYTTITRELAHDQHHWPPLKTAA